jgi:hypothetical protein
MGSAEPWQNTSNAVRLAAKGQPGTDHRHTATFSAKFYLTKFDVSRLTGR